MKAARGRGHPRHRRHGPGARGVQRRQARLRRGAGQRALLHRTTADVTQGRRATSSPARRFDNGVLCSSPNSVVVDAPIAERGRAASSPAQGGYFLSRRGGRRAGQGARHAAAAAEPGARRQVGDRTSPRRLRRDACRPDTRVLLRQLDGRRPRLPALDREALPGALLLRRRATGGRAASAASRSCATAAWATPCRSTRRTSR